MLALAADHSLINVYRKLSPEFAFKGIPLKLTEMFVISIEKTFVGIFLDGTGLACTSDDSNALWVDWKGRFLTIVNIHASIKTKRVRSGKVTWITSNQREGMRSQSLLSQ